MTDRLMCTQNGSISLPCCWDTRGSKVGACWGEERSPLQPSSACSSQRGFVTLCGPCLLWCGIAWAVERKWLCVGVWGEGGGYTWNLLGDLGKETALLSHTSHHLKCFSTCMLAVQLHCKPKHTLHGLSEAVEDFWRKKIKNPIIPHSYTYNSF